MKNTRSEVLRYMGYKDQDIEDDLQILIDELINECRNISQRRYVKRELEIEIQDDSVFIKEAKLEIKSKSLSKHLDGCQRIILIAFTLGNEIEMKIEYYKKSNLLKSLIIDASASTIIEELCDEISMEIQSDFNERGFDLTSRFSPGYGDLDLKYQFEILKILDAYKNIGLTVLSSNILIPRKSVTAFIGIKKTDLKSKEVLESKRGEGLKENKCEYCDMKENCVYRVKFNLD